MERRRVGKEEEEAREKEEEERRAQRERERQARWRLMWADRERSVFIIVCSSESQNAVLVSS